MAQWFETKVRYDKTMENGSIKKVTEAYMVDALSFTEAEARISEEISHFTSDFSVSAVKRTKIAEIFREKMGDKWDGMKGTMADFEINTIQETLIMDVYDANLGGEEKVEA